MAPKSKPPDPIAAMEDHLLGLGQEASERRKKKSWEELDKDAGLSELRVVGPRDAIDSRLWTKFAPLVLELNAFEGNLLQEAEGAETMLWNSNLRTLDLSGNKILEIPADMLAPSAGKLTYLNLSANQIAFLPSSLLQCEGLATLRLGHNGLTSLPECLFDCLPALATLDVSHNQLTSFPSEGGSDALRELNVSDNSLSMFAVTDQFPNLVKLDLSSNQMTEAFSVDGLGKLKELFLQENKLTDKKLAKLAATASEEGKAMKQLLTQLRGGSTKGAQKRRQKGEAQDEARNATGLLGRFGDLLCAEPVRIVMEKEVCILRPVYAAVVVKGVDFSQEGRLERFLALQLKLQGTRRHLGIGSHDFASMGCHKFRLAAVEQTEKFEALQIGKEGQSDVLSGLQPISDWLAHWRSNDSSRAGYASKAVDGDGKVCVLKPAHSTKIFTLYPVSNCEASKTTASTSEIFIEVSGNAGPDSVKAGMLELLQFILEAECWRSRPELRFQWCAVVDWKDRKVLDWEKEFGELLAKLMD